MGGRHRLVLASMAALVFAMVDRMGWVDWRRVRCSAAEVAAPLAVAAIFCVLFGVVLGLPVMAVIKLADWVAPPPKPGASS